MTFSAGLRLLRPWCIQKNKAPSNSARGSREGCEFPSGVWGKAPAEIEFGAFWPKI